MEGLTGGNELSISDDKSDCHNRQETTPVHVNTEDDKIFHSNSRERSRKNQQQQVKTTEMNKNSVEFWT